jgi:hypothetical protein
MPFNVGPAELLIILLMILVPIAVVLIMVKRNS